MEYQLISPRNKRYTAIEQVLINRGIPPQNISHYLCTSEEDNLNPLSIMNIHEGAVMLIQHIINNDSIFIIVD